MIFRMLSIVMMIVNIFVSVAAATDIFEIPHEVGDKRVPVQPVIDHFVYYTKTITCSGQKVDVLYKMMIGGVSRGTRFVGTCQKIFGGSVDTCGMDESAIAKTCFNKAIDFYGLENRHKKIAVETNIDGKPMREPLPVTPNGNVSR